MNARLFFTTFLMIFLAELGDKTQLSVIGRVTDPTTKWIVFAASSLALVCSTLIAVQCGGLLARTIEPRMIKTGAGVLFLVIGALTLVDGLRPAHKPVSEKPTGMSAVGRLVLAQATRFETIAARDYRALADRTANPAIRAVLIKLADSESGHLAIIDGLRRSEPRIPLPAGTPEALPSESELCHDVATSDVPVLDHAIAHERSTAAFYAHLAQVTVVPSLKRAFQDLSQSEMRHVDELMALKTRLAPAPQG